MDKIKHASLVALPAIIFSFLGYTTLTGSIGEHSGRRRGQLMHDIMMWLSNTLGAVPAGLLLIAAGFLFSFLAYRKLFAAS